MLEDDGQDFFQKPFEWLHILWNRRVSPVEKSARFASGIDGFKEMSLLLIREYRWVRINLTGPGTDDQVKEPHSVTTYPEPQYIQLFGTV